MKKEKKNLLTIINKYISWTLVIMGLLMLGATFFKVSAGLLITFSALIFIIAGFLAHFLLKDQVPDHPADKTSNSLQTIDIWSGFFSHKDDSSPDVSALKLQLSYLAQLIDPLAPVKNQVGLICKTLAEIMPENIIFSFELKHRKLLYLSGARLSNFATSTVIKEQDPVVGQISSRIESFIGPQNLQPNSIWSEETPFHDQASGKTGLIIPGNLYGKTNLLLVCIPTCENEISPSQIEILRHAAVCMAIIFDNQSSIQQKSCTNSHDLEKEIGKSILQKNLSEQMPAINGWELSRVCRSNNGDGKDFCIFANISSDQTLIIVGSSSGKGLDAALFLVKLKTIVGCLAENCKSPSEILNRLSIQLSNDSANELFASVIALKIKKNCRAAQIAVAGQSIPFIYRQRNGFVEIPSLECGVPVGLFNQGIEPYKDQEIQLMPGDGILLYTDGVFDLTAAGGQSVKSEDLKILLENVSEESAENILSTLSQQLQIADNNNQEEECTLLYAKTE